MDKKVIAMGGFAAIAAAVAVLAGAIIASAQTENVSATANISSNISVNPSATEPQEVLEIGANGGVLLRGTIASIANGTITVNSWGGTWTVNVPSGAAIYPAATTDYATQFQAGDFVGVQGTVANGTSWTVNATLVRDWTYRATVTTQEKTNVQAAQGVRATAPRDYIGTASNVSGSSFTLTASGNDTYTVNTGAGTEIVNRNWATLPFANIQNGDSVRVYGVNASGTVTAQIVRDVTIPIAAAHSTSTNSDQ